MRTRFLAQVLLGGTLVFVGCDAPELAAVETEEVYGVLFDRVGDDHDDHKLVLNVDVDETTFTQVDLGDGVGPFNVEGDTGSGPRTFQCWGWILPDGSGNVSQVYNIAGHGAIMTQGQEGGFLTVVGGTGDFRNARGQGEQVFTGNGFDFTITFDLNTSTGHLRPQQKHRRR